MAKVTGLGGVFFKSADPKKLTAWYHEHLGIPIDEYGYVTFPNPDTTENDKDSYTVWSPFKDDTQYFKPSDHSYMVNFRVDDLDSLLTQLRASGVEVDEKTTDDEYGKFGWCMDPEGRRIELWQTPKKNKV